MLSIARIYPALTASAACAAIVTVMTPAPAEAHGFAGSRFFPATLATDDPFVSDEASLPTYTFSQNPGTPFQTEHDFSGEVFKTIFPNFGIGAAETFQVINSNGAKTVSGFGNLELSAKYQFYKNDEHEALMSIGLGTEIGGTGSHIIGADTFSTYTPQFFFGKGMGDLPDSMKWLKPLAVTGVLGMDIPDSGDKTEPDGSITANPRVFNWGFAIEYSIPYLQSQVEDVGIRKPFNRLIPVVEFPFSNPIEGPDSGKISGSVNPGLIWAGQYYQLGVEAVIPINQRTARGVGVIAQLHFFIDDIAPSVFGKPLSDLVFGK